VAPRTARILRWLAGFVFVAVLIAATHSLWLGALGKCLISAEAPTRADIVVVLAGDEYGFRVLKAAELVRDGYAPRVLVSGPVCCYGAYESDLAIAFAVRHGYPAGWFIPLPNQTSSTREEAQCVVQELRRRNIHRFLVVTSNYHTARAARVYRRLAPPDSFRMVAAPDRYFIADGWWRDRHSQKLFALEWLKTMAYWIGF
jgi:uncharacterized SAM-binding protein YcdF (DUF218 family)